LPFDPLQQKQQIEMIIIKKIKPPQTATIPILNSLSNSSSSSSVSIMTTSSTSSSISSGLSSTTGGGKSGSGSTEITSET